MSLNLRVGRIKYRGVLDFNAIYHEIFHALGGMGYTVIETKYKHKPPVDFILNVNAKKKVTGYVMYVVDVAATSQNFTYVDMTIDGKKKKMFKGNLRIDIYPRIETDYEGNWSTGPLMEKFKNFFDNYIYQWRLIFTHHDALHHEGLHLFDDLKKILNEQGRSLGYERLEEDHG